MASSTSGAQGIITNAVYLEWINTTISWGASKPPQIFIPTIFRATEVIITDSDLSAYNAASGVILWVAAVQAGQFILQNCKIASGIGYTGGTWPTGSMGEVIVINADDADTKTTFAYYNAQGSLLSTESIYRNSGFSVGSTNVGWQIVTTSACSEQNPFVTPWMTGGFNTTTSAANADIKIIHDSVTNLHNRNLWSEVRYVSDASFPKGTLADTRNARPLDGTSVDWTTDSDTWTGTGGFANANKQRVRATFTPAEGSAIEGRLFVGEASKTLYLDPQLVMS
jgi:hypothetical protein